MCVIRSMMGKYLGCNLGKSAMAGRPSKDRAADVKYSWANQGARQPVSTRMGHEKVLVRA